MTIWETTVTEVVLIFRDALRALAPHLSKARIEWREDAAYDDWDEIAQMLYQKIVVASAVWSLPEDDQAGVDFAAYDMMYESYAGKTLIVVDAPGQERLVFHSFGTRDEPFDVVRARILTKDGRVAGNDFVIVEASAVTYRVETRTTTISYLIVNV